MVSTEAKAVIKGRGISGMTPGATVRLRHYRVDVARWRREQTRPGEVPPGLVNAGTALRLEEKRSYLLFLAALPDGSYEALSGHTFPTDAVYRLESTRWVDPSGK